MACLQHSGVNVFCRQLPLLQLSCAILKSFFELRAHTKMNPTWHWHKSRRVAPIILGLIFWLPSSRLASRKGRGWVWGWGVNGCSSFEGCRNASHPEGKTKLSLLSREGGGGSKGGHLLHSLLSEGAWKYFARANQIWGEEIVPDAK